MAVPGREFALGLGRGSLAQTGVEIETPAPYAVLGETATMVRRLLAGETVRFGEYAELSDVFGLNPEARMHLRFEPRAPVRTYLGGYGPTALETAGHHMDGLLFGGWFLPLLKAGRVEGLVDRAQAAARSGDRDVDFRVLAGLNVAIAEEPQRAYAFARTHVSHAVVTLNRQLEAEELTRVGIDPGAIDRLEAAFDAGATVQEATELVTDAMVDAFFVVGDADDCVDQLREIDDRFAPPVDRVVFGKLGPDLERGVSALADDVLPAL